MYPNRGEGLVAATYRTPLISVAGRVVLMLVLVWALVMPVQARTLRITTFDYHTPVLDALAEALGDVYQQLGIDMDLVRLPGRRALLDAAQGRADGELTRIALDTHAYPDLIRVPIPLLEIGISAWSPEPSIRAVRRWADLQRWQVGALRGMLVVEHRLGDQAEYANSLSSLKAMLEYGRVQALVLPNPAAQGLIQAQPLPNKVLYASQVLEHFKLYHYVHVRHQALVEPLTQRLSDEQASGRWTQRMRRYGLGADMNSAPSKQNTDRS